MLPRVHYLVQNFRLGPGIPSIEDVAQRAIITACSGKALHSLSELCWLGRYRLLKW